jgi:hypothetical protein
LYYTQALHVHYIPDVVPVVPCLEIKTETMMDVFAGISPTGSGTLVNVIPLKPPKEN